VKAFVLILRHTGLRISDAARLDVSKTRGGKVFVSTRPSCQRCWSRCQGTATTTSKLVKPRKRLCGGCGDRTLQIIFALAEFKGACPPIPGHLRCRAPASRSWPTGRIRSGWPFFNQGHEEAIRAEAHLRFALPTAS